jgi:hypothetical protein
MWAVAAAGDEQVVELGRAVGPHDVGGLVDGDAGPQVTGAGQEKVVDGLGETACWILPVNTPATLRDRGM